MFSFFLSPSCKHRLHLTVACVAEFYLLKTTELTCMYLGIFRWKHNSRFVRWFTENFGAIRSKSRNFWRIRELKQTAQCTMPASFRRRWEQSQRGRKHDQRMTGPKPSWLGNEERQTATLDFKGEWNWFCLAWKVANPLWVRSQGSVGAGQCSKERPKDHSPLLKESFASQTTHTNLVGHLQDNWVSCEWLTIHIPWICVHCPTGPFLLPLTPEVVRISSSGTVSFANLEKIEHPPQKGGFCRL